MTAGRRSCDTDSVNVLPLQGVVGDVGERGPPGPDGKEVTTLLRLSSPLAVLPSTLFCIFDTTAHSVFQRSDPHAAQDSGLHFVFLYL